jgi:hypothetical protein
MVDSTTITTDEILLILNDCKVTVVAESYRNSLWRVVLIDRDNWNCTASGETFRSTLIEAIQNAINWNVFRLSRPDFECSATYRRILDKNTSLTQSEEGGVFPSLTLDLKKVCKRFLQCIAADPQAAAYFDLRHLEEMERIITRMEER